mmetsp:Transcript_15170/g.22718  ORF Transcript_15170/g.22718 Transcript_15170/m.22718 type:complete len:248 (+) Transcript_15170:95-838(+)
MSGTATNMITNNRIALPNPITNWWSSATCTSRPVLSSTLIKNDTPMPTNNENVNVPKHAESAILRNPCCAIETSVIISMTQFPHANAVSPIVLSLMFHTPAKNRNTSIISHWSKYIQKIDMITEPTTYTTKYFGFSCHSEEQATTTDTHPPIKRRRAQTGNDGATSASNRWVVIKINNGLPIGMRMPHTLFHSPSATIGMVTLRITMIGSVTKYHSCSGIFFSPQPIDTIALTNSLAYKLHFQHIYR